MSYEPEGSDLREPVKDLKAAAMRFSKAVDVRISADNVWVQSHLNRINALRKSLLDLMVELENL